MSTAFPTALDSFTNPSGSALQGSPTPRKHSEQHGDLNDAVEAIEAQIGTTASPVLARLGGVAGGQALNGGTAASETLSLASTSHATKGKVLLGTLSAYDELADRLGVGTASPSAKLHGMAITEQLRIGYDAANYLSATVGSTGEATLAATGGTITLQGVAATDSATLGSELLTTGGWTVTAGWTESPDDVFTHANGGGTTTLSNSASISSATKYQISWTITGRTAGSVAIAVGGQSLSSQNATGSFGPTTTSTAAFTITPTNDFDGALSLVSLKPISAISKPVLSAKASGSSVTLEIRALTDLSSTAVGVGALRYQTTGLSNAAFGNLSLRSLTTGQLNSALGVSSLSLLTTGVRDTAVGNLALANATTANDNTAVGYSALLNISTSPANVGIGYQAGRYQANGSTALATAASSVYIGASARGFSDSDNFSVVIGSAAIGLGANTSVIGTINQTTAATIYGAGTFSLTNATTNAAVTVGTLTKNVTGAGVGAAGLGPRLTFAAESSTTDDTTQADITATWTDATHATRKSRLALSAYDTAAREGVRLEADGSVARLGFFGATAVVKPTALTATVAAAPAGGTGTAGGGWDTAGNRDLAIATINNLKTRVDQLETKLQALGLLT